MILLYNPRDRELQPGLSLGVQREGQFSNYLRDLSVFLHFGGGAMH